MALDRKDVRFKLDPDEHKALAKLADADQLDIGEFVEREVIRVVHERSLKATVLAEDEAIRGIAGKIRESQGVSRK